MSTFLEKNKKKSALAALLLFIRTRKTVTALLLLVALASFLFVSPSNFILSFPGGDRVAAGVAWMAGKVGVDTSKWGLAGGKREYGDLVAAFRAAKEGGGKAGWSAFMRGGAEAAAARRAAGGTGSLGMVKGSAKDLEAAGGSGANLPTPGSVAGVLNPDDARNTADGEGVALSEEDLAGEREGLVKSAFAGGFGTGSGSGSGAAGGGLSGGSFASAGFFGGGKGATTGKLGDVVRGGLEGISAEPGKGVPVKGGAAGRLSRARASAITARTGRGMVRTYTINGQRAFVQLAAGRGRAAISVAPNCSAGGNCPGEFATTNTGAVYDGNKITGANTDILTAPQVDGIDTPNVPNSGMADDYIAQAEKMDKDAQTCREKDEYYAGTSTSVPHHNPTEIELDSQQQALSLEFDRAGCGQGGCSKSKAKKCQKLGDKMKAKCRETMEVRCRHMRECPLTAASAANCSPDECDGGAREKDRKVVNSDGVRSRTMDDCYRSKDGRNDMGDRESCEEGPGCVDAKQNVITVREAGKNAVTEYRTHDCVNLRAIKEAGNLSVFDQLAANLNYTSKCSGRESQVLDTCKRYADALCARSKNCSGADCNPEEGKAECVIEDLNGIEEFFNSEVEY